MVTTWTPGTELSWSATRTTGGLRRRQTVTLLDNLRIVIIPDDATRILKLKAGELDAAEFVPFSRMAELKADPKLNMVLSPAAQILCRHQQPAPAQQRHTEPLSDMRVRQALNYAVNKDAIIQVMTYGAGKPQVSPISTKPLYGKRRKCPTPTIRQKRKR